VANCKIQGFGRKIKKNVEKDEKKPMRRKRSQNNILNGTFLLIMVRINLIHSLIINILANILIYYFRAVEKTIITSPVDFNSMLLWK